MTQADDRADSIDQFPMPLVLANAARTRIVRYEPEQPGLGFSASYASGYFTIGVFVYSGGLAQVPEDPLSPVVTAHLKQSVNEAITVGKMQGEAFVCTGAYGVPYAGNAVQYLVAKLSRQSDDGRVCSVLLLTTHANRFVKLRVTFAQAAFSTEGLARTIAGRYFALLWPNLKEVALRVPPSETSFRPPNVWDASDNCAASEEQAPHETRELNLRMFGWRGLPNAELPRSIPNISAERATHGLLVGNHALLFFDAPPRLHPPVNPISTSLVYLFAASIFHISDFRFLGILTLEKSSASDDLCFCRFTADGRHMQLGRDTALSLHIVFESEVVKVVCTDQGLNFRAMKWIPLATSNGT